MMSAPNPQQFVPTMPNAPAPAPMFGQQQKTKPQKKSTTSTFLGANMTANPTNTGQSTLLGG